MFSYNEQIIEGQRNALLPNKDKRRRKTGVTPEALVGVAMKMTDENISGNSEITMDDVKNLIKKKDDIEEQIKAYYDVLQDVSRRPYY